MGTPKSIEELFGERRSLPQDKEMTFGLFPVNRQYDDEVELYFYMPAFFNFSTKKNA